MFLKKRFNMDISIPHQFIIENFRPDEIPNKTLFQYSHASTLQNIWNNNCLWATEHRYLNDPGEMLHGLKKFYAELEKQFAQNSIENLEPTIAFLKSNPISEDLRFFVASFTEEYDLLSQWRGYGDNGCGLSMGFNAKEIPIKVDGSYLTWIKVLYEKDEQDAIVHKTVSSFITHLRAILLGTGGKANEEVRNLVLAFLQVSQTAAIGFKHHGWREEKEWRLVKIHLAKENSETLVRCRGSELIEYSKIETKPGTITQVYVGPRSKFENQSRAIKTITQNQVDIQKSEIAWN